MNILMVAGIEGARNCADVVAKHLGMEVEVADGRKAALATIVNVRGSIPSFKTAKMLVRDDGSIGGTIGGGCVVGSGPAAGGMVAGARHCTGPW